MDIGLFETTETIQTRDCDVSGAWRSDAMFLSMQEASGSHTAALGCDHEGILPRSILWVLYRMRLDIHRTVQIGEDITLRTYHTKNMRMFYPRHYEFFAKDGALVASASSIWLLMDANERRMTSCEPLNARMLETLGTLPPLERPDAVELLTGTPQAQTYCPVYSDLDLNGHVNNARYVTWLCDMLGIDCLREQRIASLLVNYRAEIRPNTQVELSLARTDGAFSLEGIHDGQQCFCCSGTLVPRS